MPTPLETQAQDEFARLESLESAARTELAEARAELDEQQAGQVAALEQLAAREAELAAVREELGGSEVPANATSGGEELRAALIALRAARAELLDAQLAVLASEDRLALAEADLTARGAEFREARKVLDEVRERARQVGDWQVAVAPGTTLAELPNQATELAGGVVFSEAREKIESSDDALPEPLRTRALERLGAALAADDAEAQQLVGLQDALDGLLGDTGGRAGEVVAPEHKLARADAKLAEYVSQAQRWLREAQTRLARISTRRRLSQAEHDALQPTSEREDALAAEHDYDQALIELAAARRRRDLRIAGIYADLSETDPPAAVADAVQEYEDEIAPHVTTVGEYGASTHPAVLHSWEAEVPEFAWEDLLDFTLAERLLDRLTTTVPAELSAAVDAAEQELVDARTDVHAADRRVEAIDALIDRTQKTLARRRETAKQRQRAALQNLR
jgi:hypothetical protein